MANAKDEVDLSRVPHVGSVVTEGDRKFATVMTDDPNWCYQEGGARCAPPTFCKVVRNPQEWFVYRTGQAMPREYVTNVPHQCSLCRVCVVFVRDVFLDANDQRAWANSCISCNVLLCDVCFGPRTSPQCPRCRVTRQRVRAPHLPPAP